MSPVPGNTASDRYAGSLHIQPQRRTHWSSASAAPGSHRSETLGKAVVFRLEMRQRGQKSVPTTSLWSYVEGCRIPDGQPVPEFIVVRLRGAAPTRQVGDRSFPHHISLPDPGLNVSVDPRVMARLSTARLTMPVTLRRSGRSVIRRARPRGAGRSDPSGRLGALGRSLVENLPRHAPSPPAPSG